MLETRNYTPQQIQEIMNIISGILVSKIATDAQQGMLQKTISAKERLRAYIENMSMVNDMENKFKKSTEKKHSKVPFITGSNVPSKN